MKKYQNDDVSFASKAAYDLDRKTSVKEFSEAYLNLCINDKAALEEWKMAHNFIGRDLSYIVYILQFIGALT